MEALVLIANPAVDEFMSTVTVLVFGDLGRSPRMLNHAKSLSDNNYQVRLVGLSGSEISSAITSDSNIEIQQIRDKRSLNIKNGIIQKSIRFFQLGFTLFRFLKRTIRKNETLLVQNPPSLPTLFITLWFRLFRASRVIIDWHNYSYSILALRYGRSHLLVRFWFVIEKWLSSYADAHLCVSAAMQADLGERFGIKNVAVIPDNPVLIDPVSPSSRQTLRKNFILQHSSLLNQNDHNALWVCSPTSWTIDEDFNLLISTIADLENSDCQHPIIFFITGKGAQQKNFKDALARIDLKRCKVLTLWLPPEEYFSTLQMMDLGLCLHTSSSGLDIPYKIPEMHGAGLPVLAFDYGETIKEIIRPKQNGELFSSKEELTSSLNLFCGRAYLEAITDALAKYLLGNKTELWSHEWNKVVHPILKTYE